MLAHFRPVADSDPSAYSKTNICVQQIYQTDNILPLPTDGVNSEFQILKNGAHLGNSPAFH